MEPSAKKIRVLIVTPTLACGGAERFVSLLCNNIDTDIVQVSLAVIDNSAPFYKITDRVPLTDLGTGRVSASFFTLRALIKKEKPDIVFTTANHLNLFTAVCKRFFPKNIIWLARETSVVSVNARHARHPLLYDWLLKKYYKRIDHIVCQSEYMQHDLVTHYNIDTRKTSVIFNAVDPSLQFDARPVQPASFITVARLSPEKGIDRVLTALAKVDMPYRYHIAGDGPQRDSLQRLAATLGIQHKVHFAGQVQEPFAGRGNSQLYLCGSHYEGFPNAILEANALGMPALAYDAPGGIAALITPGNNGFIAKDEDDFIEKIRVATNYPFNRKQISDDTLHMYSVKKMTAAIQQLFSKLYGAGKENN
jgi:glycosyltransferase involved in cell wall biosynthesis